MIIRKGDRVVVLSGAEKGKTGRVLTIYPEKKAALVERIRLVKRHTKPGRKQNMQGGIVERELPIPLCKLALIDPKTDKPTRVRSRIQGDGSKVRVAARSGEVIEKTR
jgi:large subunit ribosomal protein L24